jgi:hypothetical protein
MASSSATAPSRLVRVWRRVHRVAYAIWLVLLVARVAIALAAIGLLILDAVITHAHAQANVLARPMPDYGKAYAYSLRCFVASGVAMPDVADDPDGTQSEAMRAHARKAFDASYVMGRKLGYSDARISADLDRAQAVEARLLLQSADYMSRTKADCATLGLM